MGSSATCSPLAVITVRGAAVDHHQITARTIEAHVGIMMYLVVSICMSERCYTAKEVADLLQVDPRAVRKLCSTGQIRSIVVASQYRIPESAYAEYIEEQSVYTHEHQSEPEEYEEEYEEDSEDSEE